MKGVGQRAVSAALPIVLCDDRVPQRLEVSLDQPAELLIVIDHQDPRGMAVRQRRIGWWSRWRHEQQVQEKGNRQWWRTVARDRPLLARLAPMNAEKRQT